MTIRIYVKIRSSLQIKEAKGDPKGAEKLMRRDLDKDPRDILKSEPIIDQFAKETGYIPLQILQNQYDPYLGQGAQGRVYEVTKNGKVYALKLANKQNDYEPDREYNNRIKLRALFNGFPTHIKKHFPLIYGMGEWVYAKNTAREQQTYYYYIMEKLDPMDAAAAHSFKILDKPDGLGAPKKDASKLKVFSDEDFKIFNDIVYQKLLYGDDDVSGIIYYFSNIENQEDKNKLLDGDLPLGRFVNKYLYNYYLLWQKDITKKAVKNLNASELKSYISKLIDGLRNNSKSVVKSLADEIFIKERDVYESSAHVKKILDDHLKKINNNILNSILDPKIGLNIRSDDQELTFPEGPILELYNALKVLVKTYNIDVQDIKQSNVMKRKDGTLVVTDIGIWGFDDDEE